MKKRIFTIIASLVLALTCINPFIPNGIFRSYADETTPTQTELDDLVMDYLSQFKEPVYQLKDFDFNNDNSVDVFDLISLRQKLLAQEPGICINTLVKLNKYLKGFNVKDKTTKFHYPVVLDDHTDEAHDALYGEIVRGNLRLIDVRKVANNTGLILEFINPEETDIYDFIVKNYTDVLTPIYYYRDLGNFGFGVLDDKIVLYLKDKILPKPEKEEVNLYYPISDCDDIKYVKELSSLLRSDDFKITVNRDNNPVIVKFDSETTHITLELAPLIVVPKQQKGGILIYHNTEFQIYYSIHEPVITYKINFIK